MSEVKAEEQPAVWAVVSLMGHKQYAGRLSEEEKFGSKLGRLDIPNDDGCSGETDNWCPKCGKCKCPNPEVSRDDPSCPLHSPASRHATAPKFRSIYFGGGSVYSIDIVTEEVARIAAKRAMPKPVEAWELPKQLAAAKPHAMANQRPYSDSEITGGHDFDDDDRGDKAEF